jgi:hypothetical protein
MEGDTSVLESVFSSNLLEEYSSNHTWIYFLTIFFVLKQNLAG